MALEFGEPVNDICDRGIREALDDAVPKETGAMKKIIEDAGISTGKLEPDEITMFARQYAQYMLYTNSPSHSYMAAGTKDKIESTSAEWLKQGRIGHEQFLQQMLNTIEGRVREAMKDVDFGQPLERTKRYDGREQVLFIKARMGRSMKDLFNGSDDMLSEVENFAKTYTGYLLGESNQAELRIAAENLKTRHGLNTMQIQAVINACQKTVPEAFANATSNAYSVNAFARI